MTQSKVYFSDTEACQGLHLFSLCDVMCHCEKKTGVTVKHGARDSNRSASWQHGRDAGNEPTADAIRRLVTQYITAYKIGSDRGKNLNVFIEETNQEQKKTSYGYHLCKHDVLKRYDYEYFAESSLCLDFIQ